jgi:hypothetical protein
VSGNRRVYRFLPALRTRRRSWLLPGPFGSPNDLACAASQIVQKEKNIRGLHEAAAAAGIRNVLAPGVEALQAVAAA